jgi:holliday junction DNA helicase RuvA
MIGHITGEVLDKDERSAIIDVGGIGYIVASTPIALSEMGIGDRVSLWTHLAVREDALDLYGFRGKDELTLFRLLIGISGIGPKSALNVLALADIKTLARAITSNDSGYLTKVSGIGKKLAEKIVLELRDKVSGISFDPSSEHETEALLALETLGYPPRDVRELVRTLAHEFDNPQQIIKKALKELGGIHAG